MSDAEIIKQKLDIIDIVSEYVTLKKAGRNFKALSPFRTEKTPSLMVSPERQIFRDFGGDKGGDIITFIMEVENVTFPEALEILAEKAGIKLTKKAPETKEEKEKDKIYEINHLTQQFYSYVLEKHPAGKNALKYLTKERKIPLKLAKNFGIGFAPTTNTLTTYLMNKKKYSKVDLEKAGVVTSYSNRTTDFFRNRIIFPIHDLRGNVIAFSGRALDNTTQPKYINTRETSVYKKSKSLYGLYQAKNDIRKEKKVIIVEGELDVLSPRKEGVKNIVAAKGTALTEDHIKILKRFAEKILFCFDSDKAGTEAQRRALEIIEKNGLSAGVINLESGKDPDELINTNPVAFKKALKNEINIYDFIINSALEEFDTKTAEGKRDVLQKVLPTLSNIENEVIKEHYLKKLASDLDTTLISLLKELEKKTAIAEKKTSNSRTTSKEAPKKKETIEEYLLALILQSKNVGQSTELALKNLSNIPLQNPGISKLLNLIKNEKAPPSKIASKIPRELLTLFDEACLRPVPDFETVLELEKEIKTTTKTVKKNTARIRLKEIGQELKDEKDEKKQQKLAEEYTKLSEMLK